MSPLLEIDSDEINRSGKNKEDFGDSGDSPTNKSNVDTERPPLCFHFRENRIPVTFHSSILYDDVLLAISSRPFQLWIEKASRVFGSKCIELYEVNIESVHIIDGRVDCINMNVDSDLTDEDEEIDNEQIQGRCCLRDCSIGILVELRCTDDNTLWSILLDQPRLNVGAVSALELPVALLDDDDESLVGPEVREIEKACGLPLKQSKMINLTQRAYEKNSVHNESGLCPSFGNCSEFIRIMYTKKEITKQKLNQIRKRWSKLREEGASMSLRVMPLGDMWKVSADMKVVCALFLMERAGVLNKSQSEYYTEDENEKGLGVRNKLTRILSFSRRPPMFGQG